VMNLYKCLPTILLLSNTKQHVRYLL
jgi:hypothetical protein